jgi:hypothetical protein
MRLFLLGFLACFLVHSPAQAQGTVTSADLLKTDAIWQRDRLDSEIAALKQSYQGQLEEYLYKDKLFRIAYDQHQELQTLVSIEDMIKKGRDLGLIRGQVLISYLDLLRLKLIATEGIELSLKQRYLDRLESTIAYIRQHQLVLEQASDRDQLQAALTTFSADQKSLANLGKEVLALLAIGNLQIVYDKSVVLKTDIDSHLQDSGTLDLPHIERSSSETNRSLNAAKMKLDLIWGELVNANNPERYLLSFYDDLSRVLNPLYVNLSQSISYLGELLSI